MKRKLGKEKSPAGEKLPENLADVISQDFFSTIFHKRALSLSKYKFQLERYKIRPHPQPPLLKERGSMSNGLSIKKAEMRIKVLMIGSPPGARGDDKCEGLLVKNIFQIIKHKP